MNTTNIIQENTATQSAKLLYTAKAHTIGGRDGGSSRSSDGRLDVKLFPAVREMARTPSSCLPPAGRPVSWARSNMSPSK